MCVVCLGYSSAGCPCCSEDTTRECPDCNGTGYEAYFDEDDNEITEKEYNALPKDKRVRIECSRCHGEGEIEDEED